MKRLFIITFGWDERFAIRFLVRNRISTEDSILIITTNKSEKTEQGISNLINFINSIGVGNYRIINVPPNVNLAIKTIKKSVEEKVKDRVIYACLSGGMRWLIISTFIALMLLGDRVEKIEIDREDLEGFFEISGDFIRNIPKLITLDEKRKTVLKTIAKGVKDVKSLSKELGKDETTIRRYIEELEDFLVIKKRKPLIFELKDYVRLVLG